MTACRERSGSVAGYSRHRRAGEPACGECAEAKAAYSREFWRKNPEKQQRYRKQWDEKHPSYDRDYYQANRDRFLHEAAKRRKSRPPWWQMYPQAARNVNARRRARLAKAAVLLTPPANLAEKWNYWGGLCWMCGAEAIAWDHVKPLRAGGGHLLSNLRPACTACNSAKHARWPFDTTSWRGGRAARHDSRDAA